MRKVDYYFSVISPWSYLGHAPLHALAARQRVRIDYRPVRIQPLFDANGGLPLAKRAPARQRYRLLELQRWRQVRSVPLNLAPRYWPLDVALVDRLVLALIERGVDPANFIAAAFSALWADERDLSNRQTLTELLDAQGQIAEPMLALAEDERIGQRYEQNTQAAIAADLPGLPGYVADGEPFWGQDRLDHLEQMLASRRAAFRSRFDR